MARPRNIVILDAHVTNPGDISWGPIEKYGEVTRYERTSHDQVVERAQHADIILLNKTKLERVHFDRLPKLRLVCLLATGMDNVDVTAAAEKGIQVKNAVGYSTSAVAQHVFSLLFELTNHVALHSQSVHELEWTHHVDWCYWKLPLVELAGKTMGIYGFGQIGRRVARIARAFDMHVAVTSRHASADQHPEIRFMSLEELFETSDVVSLNAPLRADNTGVINRSLLNRMKKSAFLINTARGALINEEDLRLALTEGKLAGAALDVLSKEPPSADHPLMGLDNCIVTPHIAWAARESRERLIKIVAKNIDSWETGRS